MGSFFDLMKQPPVPFGEAYPPFTRISIETTSTCTRRCAFCPVGERPAALQTMSDRLYSSIVEQLGERGFRGVVQWFYVNEPLMDKKRHERIALLRAACPRATVHVTTNWDVMRRRAENEQIAEVRALFEAGVNVLNVNVYDALSFRGDRLMGLRAAYDTGAKFEVVHVWQRVLGRHLSVTDMSAPRELHSWGGFYQQSNAGGSGRCARPMRHIVVSWDGRVPLCCAINPAKMTSMGDANSQTLEEIWQSRSMFEYRARLQDGERSGQCQGCDERVAFPHVVRRVVV